MPPPIICENHDGKFTIKVPDPELCEIIKGPWTTVNTSDIVNRVIYIISCERWYMYNVFCTLTGHIIDNLNRCKEIKFDSHILYSTGKVIKLSSQIAIQYYRKEIYNFNNTVKQILNSNVVGNDLYLLVIRTIQRRIVPVFREKLYNLLVHSHNISGYSFGIASSVFVTFIQKALRYTIPKTNISVFEFLFMDLNLTHLPILNQEELMVEEFKELEQLIRGRCKKLKEIYDTHLIFNEKRSNFPEDCTNHILKYCQENYVLQSI